MPLHPLQRVSWHSCTDRVLAPRSWRDCTSSRSLVSPNVSSSSPRSSSSCLGSSSTPSASRSLPTIHRYFSQRLLIPFCTFFSRILLSKSLKEENNSWNSSPRLNIVSDTFSKSFFSVWHWLLILRAIEELGGGGMDNWQMDDVARTWCRRHVKYRGTSKTPQRSNRRR